MEMHTMQKLFMSFSIFLSQNKHLFKHLCKQQRETKKKENPTLPFLVSFLKYMKQPALDQAEAGSWQLRPCLPARVAGAQWFELPPAALCSAQQQVSGVRSRARAPAWELHYLLQTGSS